MTRLLFVFFLSISFYAGAQTDTATAKVHIDSLLKVNRALIKARKMEEAFSSILEAENICKNTFGADAAINGTIAVQTGRTFIYNGEYKNAKPHLLRAKSIIENAIGKNNIQYVQCLENLGLMYRLLGEFEKAETDFLEAITISKNILGKEDLYHASLLGHLATNYMGTGQYETAEKLYLEEQSIEIAKLGEESKENCEILNDLAYINSKLGKFEKAEALYLKSISTKEKMVGRDSPSMAGFLNNLAVFYDDLGIYEKAEKLYIEAKSKWEQRLGKQHQIYEYSLNNLAYLYTNMEKYKQAEQLYLEAISISEKKLGTEHPTYAKRLNNLAVLYIQTGDNRKAEELLLRAINIREKKLGNEHPDYATSLGYLGLLYCKMGRLEDAETSSLEALRIRKKTLGNNHPEIILNLNQLAKLHTLQQQYSKASEYYLQANEIEKSILVNASNYLSERELSAHAYKFSKSQDQFFSFLYFNEEETGHGFDNILFHKGFLLNASNEINKKALSDNNLYKLNLELKSYARRLAAEYAKPLSERKEQLELEEKLESLEKKLARNTSDIRKSFNQVKWQDIQNALGPKEAAIEFVHFGLQREKTTDSIIYAALVIRPDVSTPTFISLFEEKSLQSLLSENTISQTTLINNLYSTENNSLQQLIWQPLANELNNIDKIYFAPSGLLHRLNIGAIPIDEKKVLSDNFTLVKYNSTRELLNPPVLAEVKQEFSAMLYGNIDFNNEPDLSFPHPPLNDITETEQSILNDEQKNFSLRGEKWDDLPWTDVEISTINILLEDANVKSKILEGNKASEESFKAIGIKSPSPYILHLATHGFFFPDPEQNKKIKSSSEDSSSIFKTSDNPMIRSGLLLAGANHAWQNGKAFKPNLEDGILTAYEISQMDLSNTELIVLSACETGLGDIKGNEGVYGLQRAFKKAGVKYLIMSLWQVPDFQTQELMTTLYINWLEKKMNIPDAFRSAQKEIKQKYKDPFLWAGFILLQ